VTDAQAPTAIIIAGCNGAGKSTSARAIIEAYGNVRAFVNADTIARGLSAFSSETVAIEAGRIMLDWLKKLANQRHTFAFETTLSGKTYATWLRTLKAQGYLVHLYYFWLDSPETAIERIRTRVAAGGHAIPDDTVRRRHTASVANFLNLYRPIADFWRIHDNTSQGGSRMIALKTDVGEEILLPDVWNQVQGIET
jgi:predicted ABC-type ATPase